MRMLWLRGNLNPEELRVTMKKSSAEDVSSPDVQMPCADEDSDESDPRVEMPPQVRHLDASTFKMEFDAFVERLAIKCNWHQHTSTCFKHLKPGEQGGDHNCRMRIDGSTRRETCLDPETESIMLRRWHPRINNYNPLISFLLQCNMDIKFIGSGPAAKALVYYVSDYITKNELKVNVGLQALRSAIDSHEVRKSVNAMIGRREISHQRVMSYLIGGGDYYTGDDFRTIRFQDFLDVVYRFEDSSSTPCRCGCADEDDCILSLCGVTCTAIRPSRPAFQQMCLWDFVQRTCKRVVRSLFSEKRHPQFLTHEMCLRNKSVVPVIVSNAITNPNSSSENRELFCRSMLLLFKPWRHPSDLLEDSSCWTEAFDKYEFPHSLAKIISNFTVEMECKDARNNFSADIADGRMAPIFHDGGGDAVDDIGSLQDALQDDDELQNSLDEHDHFPDQYP